ncbi:hypothetical protein MUP51_06805, partial [Candidatus Bathyarchaeota archaeon]|nr:hypothetical protein [Candidatus Bathyarchaeota archaeon]
TYKPRPRIVKAKKNTGFLGPGVTARKIALVVVTLAISLGSIFMLNQWQQDQISHQQDPYSRSPRKL